jgi:hypothetical protein
MMILNKINRFGFRSILIKMYRFKVFILSLFLLVSHFANSQDVQALAKKVLGSTVSITFLNYAYSDKILGSGYVVADNIIATNYHVVSLGNEGYIQKSQTDTVKHYFKRLLAVDPENDLALIEVENLNLPILSISIEELEVGEKIYAAGNPMGLTGTFSDGIVSANRKIEEKQVIQITAPVSHGSSGGPVINAKGQVVGTVFSTYNGGQNLNFVIPAIKLAELLAKKHLPIDLQEVILKESSIEDFTTLFVEKFNDELSAKVKGMKVKAGQNSILETSPKVSYIYNSTESLRFKPDFKIEARLKTVEGKQTCLYWGTVTNDYSNYTNGTIPDRNYVYVFCHKNKKGTIGAYDQSEFKKLNDDQVLEHSKDGDFNVFSIYKKVDTVYFAINDEEVFKQKYKMFLGGGAGVGSEEIGTKVTIDYLSVKHAAKKSFETKMVDTTKKAIKLPENINSKYVDYFPVVSPDGQTLHFTRYYSPQNMGKMQSSDVYSGNILDPKASFTNKGKFNTEGNDYCFATSNDGNTLYLEKINGYEGRVRSKSYLSTYNLENEESKEIANFKSFYCYDDVSVYSINKEENVIVASVKRADTFGMLDLFFSKKDAKGNWSELRNLGQTINTEYNEGSGYITADSKYLIFNSEGHPGYGDGDLFVSERLDSTWLNWSKPLNLGPGINTKHHEDYPFLHLKGNELYFNRTIDGNADIYKLELKPEAKSNVTLGILNFEKSGLKVEVTALPENTVQKFDVGERKKVHFVFQNGKKYKVKSTLNKTMESEKELDFTKRAAYLEEEIKL